MFPERVVFLQTVCPSQRPPNSIQAVFDQFVVVDVIGFTGRLVWQSRVLETLFKWMPCLLPKHFCSFVLDQELEIQKKLEEALDTRPWVFGFADVCICITEI